MKLYDKFAAFLAAPYRETKLQRNCEFYYTLRRFLTSEKVYTGYYTGRGRFSQKRDLTPFVSHVLETLGISHKCGNDAPRGGVTGNYVRITSPAFIKEVKKAQRAEELERQRIKAEQMAKEEALKRIGEEIKRQADEFDLEPLRAEILDFLGDSYNSNYGLSRKQRGQIAWHITHQRKGINLNVLFEALKRF